MSRYPLILHIDRNNGRPVVSVTGEVDIEAEPQLRAFLECFRADEDIVFDLSGVEFMDSCGVHVLLEARQRGSVELRRVPAAIRRVLAICDVEDLFTIVDGANTGDGRKAQSS